MMDNVLARRVSDTLLICLWGALIEQLLELLRFQGSAKPSFLDCNVLWGLLRCVHLGQALGEFGRNNLQQADDAGAGTVTGIVRLVSLGIVLIEHLEGKLDAVQGADLVNLLVDESGELALEGGELLSGCWSWPTPCCNMPSWWHQPQPRPGCPALSCGAWPA